VGVTRLGPADQLQIRVDGEFSGGHTVYRGLRRHSGWEKYNAIDAQ
jgi:hypothetical protein